MEKEKMIEEMAKDIHNAKMASDYHCYEDDYTDCKKCKLSKYAENKICQDAYEACWLMEVGYRKVPEGSVVLTKEELETTDKIPQKIKDFYKWFIEIEKEQTRKEMARDIYIDYEKNIKAMYGAFDVVDAYSILEELKEICEKNGADFNDGVEVEE